MKSALCLLAANLVLLGFNCEKQAAIDPETKTIGCQSSKKNIELKSSLKAIKSQLSGAARMHTSDCCRTNETSYPPSFGPNGEEPCND